MLDPHPPPFDARDTTTFVPGDIAYDYFGIRQFIGITGEAGNDSITGVTGDILTAFTSDSYLYVPAGIQSTDNILSTDAAPIWRTNNGNLCGIRYQRDSVKTVGVFFPLENLNSLVRYPMPPGLSSVFVQFFANVFAWMDIPVNIDNSVVPILPDKVTLYPNYPNPFNNKTRIRFYIPQQSNVKVSVFDIAGRNIESIIHSEMQAGIHEVDWLANQGRLSSGIYYIRLQVEEQVFTHKVVLLK